MFGEVVPIEICNFDSKTVSTMPPDITFPNKV